MLRYLKVSRAQVQAWLILLVILGGLWALAWAMDQHARNLCLEKGYESVIAGKCAHVTYEGQ
jgi:hypothetical protein